jgi:ABC-type microcin C transport system permease subunit YejE
MEQTKGYYWKYYNLDEELFVVQKEESLVQNDPYDVNLVSFDISIPNPPPPPNKKNIDNNAQGKLGRLSTAQWLSVIDSLSESAKQEMYHKLTVLKPIEGEQTLFFTH